MANTCEPAEMTATPQATVVEEKVDCVVCLDAHFVTDCITCTAETKHVLCQGCVQGWAREAIAEASLAPGGVGLRCAMPECAGVLEFGQISPLLSEDVRKSLEDRMQRECVASADLDDLVTCSGCGTLVCVERACLYFDCKECKRRQCRDCGRLYDDDHVGVPCELLANLQTELNEAIVRVCHRCQTQFVKSDGCNKMTCRCDATQCYLCREPDVSYDHFCMCDGQFETDTEPCAQCGSRCRLFADAEALDEERLAQMRGGRPEIGTLDDEDSTKSDSEDVEDEEHNEHESLVTELVALLEDPDSDHAAITAMLDSLLTANDE